MFAITCIVLSLRTEATKNCDATLATRSTPARRRNTTSASYKRRRAGILAGKPNNGATAKCRTRGNPEQSNRKRPRDTYRGAQTPDNLSTRQVPTRIRIHTKESDGAAAEWMSRSQICLYKMESSNRSQTNTRGGSARRQTHLRPWGQTGQAWLAALHTSRNGSFWLKVQGRTQCAPFQRQQQRHILRFRCSSDGPWKKEIQTRETRRSGGRMNVEE